jgi:hypothetical protein
MLLVAAGVVAVVRHRALAALPEAVRQRAAADGVRVRFGTVRVGLWVTVARDLEITFAAAPGVRVTVDAATLRPPSSGVAEIALGHAHLEANDGAVAQLAAVWDLGLWQNVSLTWDRLTVAHTDRLTGRVELDQVTVEGQSAAVTLPPSPLPLGDRGPSLTLRVGTVALGARRWRDVTIAVKPRGQMLDLGFGGATIPGAPVVIGVFPSQGGAWGIIGTVTHPPAPMVARAFDIVLGTAFAGAHVGGSFSFTVPDDPARPLWARLELLVSGWPSPDAPDAAAVLGTTVGLGARPVFAADRGSVALEGARLSTSLFSLGGSGALGLDATLPLSLDLTGSLTCAQIRGNLRPSAVLTTVSRYLDAAPSRAAERVTMRIQLEAALATTRAPRLAWKLDPGCGYGGFTFGSFWSPAPRPAN